MYIVYSNGIYIYKSAGKTQTIEGSQQEQMIRNQDRSSCIRHNKFSFQVTRPAKTIFSRLKLNIFAIKT